MKPWLRMLRHRLFCKADAIQLERVKGEMFLRCATCWLRTTGLQTGPPRLVNQIPGDPLRHRLNVVVPLVDGPPPMRRREERKDRLREHLATWISGDTRH